jgi:hypothetical protein
MGSLTEEVISAFNNFLDEQKAIKGKAFLTLVLFSNKYEMIFDKVDLKKVQHIDKTVYKTEGMTAMYDAIGKTIHANASDEKVIVLIQTDGAENSSQEYTKPKVKEMIEKKEAKGWKFIFIGANIDAASEGSSIGISAKNSVQFEASANGVHGAYAAMSAVSRSFRANS